MGRCTRVGLAFVAAAVWSAPAQAEGEREPPPAHDGPLGHAGRTRTRRPDDADLRRELERYGYDARDFAPVPDRWRIPFPRWDRYATPSESDLGADSPYSIGRRFNPFRQNVLKGDYPILGQNTFLQIQVLSDTVFEFRELPTPAAISTAAPRTPEFFGSGEQFFFSSNLGITVELFQGNTAFKPPDFLIRFTPVFNGTFLDVLENNTVNIDVREDTSRTDGHVGIQEAFVEKHIVNLSANYDFLSVTVGIQPFISDFRGLLFFDNNLGIRATANLDNNQTQLNLAFFDQIEKNTNSELNGYQEREQYVLILNAYRQDFIWPGYTAQLSFHYNHDPASGHIDENGVPVRPGILGRAEPHRIEAFYLGWAGDGHIGRLNITHEYFFAFGEDSMNPLAARRVDLRAHLLFVELSVDFDWYRLRASLLWASGDDDPTDADATGFDAIFDNPNFAGGASSFWIRQNLRLLGVGLVHRLSALPTLRSSKIEGQANFVNPGIWFLTVGADAELLQELRVNLNLSYLRFDQTGALEPFLNQNDVESEIGFELTLAAQYRPRLTNNIQLTAGASVFLPGSGFGDLYESRDALASLFLQLTLTF
ncbi:MAG: hypothetical protein ACE5JG_04235 [Planctomycetota bacterium]